MLKVPIDVRFAALDAFGHVNNAVYLSDELRSLLLAQDPAAAT